MIEIISIENSRKSPQKKRKFTTRKIRQFLAEHVNKTKTFVIPNLKKGTSSTKKNLHKAVRTAKNIGGSLAKNTKKLLTKTVKVTPKAALTAKTVKPAPKSSRSNPQPITIAAPKPAAAIAKVSAPPRAKSQPPKQTPTTAAPLERATQTPMVSQHHTRPAATPPLKPEPQLPAAAQSKQPAAAQSQPSSPHQSKNLSTTESKPLQSSSPAEPLEPAAASQSSPLPPSAKKTTTDKFKLPVKIVAKPKSVRPKATKLPKNQPRTFEIELNQHFQPKTSAPRKARTNTNISQPTPPKTKKSYNRISETIWNFLQLISTAGLIFAIAFIAMNWSAYQVILEKRWSDFWGLTDNSTLVKIASDRQFSQDLLPAGSDQFFPNTIPDLNIEVAPSDTRIIIPRINKNVPVVPVSVRNLIRRDWGALENDIQNALRGGVVHYPGTALPGEAGNVVITGHSSYFPWDPGRFKDVFALLHDLRVNDRIVVYHDQVKHIYQITNVKVILPEQVEVLNQGGSERLTLLTCTPIGTNLKRLVIEAKPI